MKTAVFTKSFQEWPIPKVCEKFRDLGVDGLDLTVRPGGHIEPKNVVKELPQAVNAAHEEDVELLFLTTGVTDPNADAERLLATAAEYGIKRIKLGYYRYSTFGTLRRQMDDVRRRLTAVAKLAARYQVLPCVHIHSGAFIPSHGTMLYELIRDLPPTEIGAYVDMLHTVKEGAGDGWRQGLDLLAPWISLAAVKNFYWIPTHRDKLGQQRYETRVCPLADGVSPIPDYVAALKKLNYDGVYSLHSEYKGQHSFKNLDTEGCFKQTTEDLAFFKKLFA